jgi:hypothetical protein
MPTCNAIVAASGHSDGLRKLRRHAAVLTTQRVFIMPHAALLAVAGVLPMHFKHSYRYMGICHTAVLAGDDTSHQQALLREHPQESLDGPANIENIASAYDKAYYRLQYPPGYMKCSMGASVVKLLLPAVTNAADIAQIDTLLDATLAAHAESNYNASIWSQGHHVE